MIILGGRTRSPVTGAAGGRELADHGVVFDIGYVSLLMQNSHGGFDTGFVGAGPLGVTATVDTEKFCGHEGGTFFIDWEFNRWYNRRYSPGGIFDPTGSFVGVNTNFIDADVAELNQIAQLYYEQSWLDDGALLAFGKMDANVRFRFGRCGRRVSKQHRHVHFDAQRLHPDLSKRIDGAGRHAGRRKSAGRSLRLVRRHDGRLRSRDRRDGSGHGAARAADVLRQRQPLVARRGSRTPVGTST